MSAFKGGVAKWALLTVEMGLCEVGGVDGEVVGGFDGEVVGGAKWETCAAMSRNGQTGLNGQSGPSMLVR